MEAESPLARQTDHPPLDHGYLFSASGIGKKFDAKAAIEWLKHQDNAGEEFIWLQFHDIPTVLDGWPLEHVELPQAFGDTLKEASRSTRIEHVQKNLIAVVNEVDYDFERKKPLKVATLWLNAGARCLLSVRSLPLRSVDQLRLAVERGEAFHSPMGLLIRLLQQQADALLGIVRNSAQTANNVEEMLLAGKLPTRSSLGGIRRDLVRLRRLLAPEPGALFRLVNRPPHWVKEDDAQSLRQSAEEFSLTLRDMAGLQERIEMLEEDIADRVGEHTNRSVLILTAVTVIALPTNLIAGLMGMNVGGIPLRYDNKGFWIVAVMSAVLTSLAAWLIFRRRQD
jgi:zinc transporter